MRISHTGRSHSSASHYADGFCAGICTRTEAYHTEVVMTNAVIRELATRTRLRVTPQTGEDADAVLHGTILKESVTPLTYNSSTQESSSFLITVVASVTPQRAGRESALRE